MLQPRMRATLGWLSTLAATAAAQIDPGASSAGTSGTATEFAKGEYAVLDDQQAPWTNLNCVPLRAFAITPDNFHVYAVNVHDSTLRFFDFFSGNPAISTWRMPWGPVSVALYDAHPDGVERALVVCRGTHALAIVDRLTGAHVDLVALPFEPADILVDELAHRAFISCSGARQVVQIDLLTLAQRIYDIPALQPTWLAWDGNGRVLVAPLISGNNSTTFATGLGESVVLDLDNPNIAPAGGLPDEDLFAIDPVAQTVVAVSRHAGTILTAHALNPVSGNHWQLGLESINKRASLQSEPALNGIFVENRLSITALPAPGGGLTSVHDIHYLDDADLNTSGIQFDPALTVGYPTGMTFTSTGYGVVCGAFTDNVTIVAPGPTPAEGTSIIEWNLPEGSIPRYAAFDPLGETLCAVYCWGTNRILVYGFAPFDDVPDLVLDLGYDPTPAEVKAGRRLFHDASKSLNNNLTCGSCHIEGGSDQLAWNLSGKPLDTKGPLHTQTLFGIDRLAPFHWRGERPELEDFNAAFTGLLGGAAELSAAEFEQFKQYVFSLRSPANIGADETRVLNDALAHVQPNGFVGSAVTGQQRFMRQAVDGSLTCMDCHSLPTASDNDLISEEATLIPSMSHMETTAFNELEDKDMPIVPLVLANGTVSKPLTGFALLHDGTINSRFDFVNAPVFALDDQGVADVTAYVEQFDSGFGKAIHRAALLDADHAGMASYIQSFLLEQARAGNCSVAVFGSVQIGGSPVRLNWHYKPGLQHFVSEDGDLAPVRFNAFVTAAAQGLQNLFVALPPGNAERAAVDFDLDGLFNQDELEHATNALVPDTDADGFFDGTEVQYGSDPNLASSTPSDGDNPVIKNLEVVWVTAKNARVTFNTNEPCSVQIDYGTTNGPTRTLQAPELRKVHSLLLTRLLPSTFGDLVPPEFEVFNDYTGTVTVTDDAGLQSVAPLPGFTTKEFILLGGTPPVAVVSDFDWTLIGQTPNGGLTATGSVGVSFKVAGPPPIATTSYVVVGNILKNGQIVPFSSPSPTQSFKINGVNFSALPGPFLITPPTDVNGRASFQFSLSGLTAGDQVRFNVIGVYFADVAGGYTPTDPDFGGAINPIPALNWSIGDTPKELRGIELTF